MSDGASEPAGQGPGSTFEPGKVVVLGFGFLAITMTVSLYTSYVPILLRHFVGQELWVGVIMALRYVFALTLQPYMVARSDRTWTRLGRRLPYLLVGMPAAAIFFFAIPYSRVLAVLLVFDILFNISLTTCYGPTVALMPDITPSAARSRANSLINLMGGVGALIAYLALGPLAAINTHLPYAAAAVALIVAPIIVRGTVHEPRSGRIAQESGFRHLLGALREVASNRDRSALLLLIAIFFWFVGQISVNVFFTTYGTVQLHMTTARAMLVLGVFAVVFLFFAVPVGWLSGRFGRRRMILAGLVGMAAAFFGMVFVHSTPGIIALMVLGGASWACINVNSYPWVADMTLTKVGAYTGLYYLSSGLAAAVGQPVVGRIIDATGFGGMFVAAAVCCAVAFVLIFLARTERVAA